MSSSHANEPLNNLSLQKSNAFTTAKFSASLLEHKVMDIAIARIEALMPHNTDSPLVAKLYPGELKRLLSDSTHIYRDLKILSKRIVGHNLFMEDGKGNFKAHAIVTDAIYEDGVFSLVFNNVIREHILFLEKNFTTFELSVITNFSRSSSLRLYEVLKKELYKIKKGDYESCTQVEYNLAELRFIIGLANSDDANVKNQLSRMSGGNVDWDVLYDRLDKKDKKYEEWRDFQRKVLVLAQEELAEKSDIRFEYEGIRIGRKIKRILFTIYRNIPKNPSVIDERKAFLEKKESEYRQQEIPMDIPQFESLYDEYVGHNYMSQKDIDLLLKKADYDVNKVRSAITLADSQPEITNYMGWLIRCIENDYTKTGTVEGDAETYKVVEEIREDYKKQKSSVAKMIWSKYKEKEEFEDFVLDVFDALPIEQIELAYSAEELCKMYTEWHTEKSL